MKGIVKNDTEQNSNLIHGTCGCNRIYLLFSKKKQEKNLAKNILGDILMVAGEVLFWARFPKTYTKIELTIQSVLVLLYFGTMGYVAVAAKVKELRKEE